MTIIALDPGVSTGVAIHKTAYDHDGQAEPASQVDEYLTAVIVNVPDLWDIIDKHRPTTVVMENFSAGGLISKDGQATLRLIGAIEAVCYRLGIPYVIQYPQERYKFIPTARAMLQQIKRTPISHEIDALSHLLLYEDRVAKGLQDGLNIKRARLI
jgi:hypothetical protein